MDTITSKFDDYTKENKKEDNDHLLVKIDKLQEQIKLIETQNPEKQLLLKIEELQESIKLIQLKTPEPPAV